MGRIAIFKKLKIGCNRELAKSYEIILMNDRSCRTQRTKLLPASEVRNANKRAHAKALRSNAVETEKT